MLPRVVRKVFHTVLLLFSDHENRRLVNTIARRDQGRVCSYRMSAEGRHKT